MSDDFLTFLSDFFSPSPPLHSNNQNHQNKIEGELSEREDLLQSNTKNNIQGFEYRPEQKEMAKRVHESLVNSEVLMIEAGTGVGKTLAYLLPLLYHCHHNDKRVAISTETKSLQEQILNHDLPLAQKILDIKVSAELCMGATNYVCKRRLKEVLATGAYNPEDFNEASIEIFLNWEKESKGLLTQYQNALPYNFKQKIARDTNDCLGSKCQHHKISPYFVARRAWQKAQVLIVNHSLLANHLALMSDSDGKARLLPEFHYLVVDEAHSFPEILQKAFSEKIDLENILPLLKTNANLFHPSTQASSRNIDKKKSEQIERDINALKKELKQIFPDAYKKEIRITSEFTSQVAYNIINKLDEQVIELERVIKELSSQQKLELGVQKDKENNENTSETNLQFNLGEMKAQATYKQVVSVKKILEKLVGTKNENEVFWISRAHNKKKQKNQLRDDLVLKTENQSKINDTLYACHSSPLDAKLLSQKYLFSHFESIIFTSATLTGAKENPFFYYKQELGFDSENTSNIEPITLQLASPFDFKKRSLLYIAKHITDPTSSFESFHKDIASETHKLLEMSEGGAFVLFTATKSLQYVQQLLEEKNKTNYVLLSQVTLGAGLALNKFKANSKKNAVLLGLSTFWQGIDIRGSALRLVILTRIPFRVPDEPVLAARMEHEKANYRDPFKNLQLPQAIMSIRQGFGRLIRSYEDKGVVAILDPRIKTKKYGQEILSTLPPSSIFENFDSLTKAYKKL